MGLYSAQNASQSYAKQTEGITNAPELVVVAPSNPTPIVVKAPTPEKPKEPTPPRKQPTPPPPKKASPEPVVKSEPVKTAEPVKAPEPEVTAPKEKEPEPTPEKKAEDEVDVPPANQESMNRGPEINKAPVPAETDLVPAAEVVSIDYF